MIAVYDPNNGNVLVSTCDTENDLATAEQLEGAGLIAKDCGTTPPKWTWNTATLLFDERIEYETRVAPLAFWSRFTDVELVTIETAREELPEASHRAAIRVLYNKLNAVQTEVDLQDARTIAGVQMLVSLTLLTQERADVILTCAVVS